MNINAVSSMTNMYNRSFKSAQKNDAQFHFLTHELPKSLNEDVFAMEIPDDVDDKAIVGTRLVDGYPASVTAGEVRMHQAIEKGKQEAKALKKGATNAELDSPHGYYNQIEVKHPTNLETEEEYYNRKLYSTEWTM